MRGENLLVKKSQESFDLVVYSIGLAFTFLMVIFSRWLSKPIMGEIESGKSLVDLVFNGNDQISFLWNLLLPTLLIFTGVIILIGLLFQMGKAIVSKQDSRLNKLLLILIAHLVFIDLIFAVKNGWQLLVLNFQYIAILVVLLIIIGTTIQYFVKLKK